MKDEARKIIELHRRKYPLMETQDVYKLLYQRELGGAHIMQDEAALKRSLDAEYFSAQPSVGDPAEDIGNGRVRLHIRECIAAGLSSRTLFNAFRVSASNRRGSMDELKSTLEAAGGMTGFIAEGCPMMHHSGAYRAAYHPAYRVADKPFGDYIALLCRIDTLLGVKGSVTVAIDGRSGAGKSALARLLLSIYPARVLHMDDHFLPKRKRTAKRLSEPGGNVDYERFKTESVENLDKDINYRRFDCMEDILHSPERLRRQPVNIVEGAYALHPYFGEYYDIGVFLDVEPQEQERRILERNGDAMLKRFKEEWIPLENAFFGTLNLSELCDFIYKPGL